MEKNKHFICNVGDNIRIMDRSYLHYVSDGMYDDRRDFSSEMMQLDKKLYCMKAIVTKAPYMKEYIFDAHEPDNISKDWFIDVYVPELDIYVSMAAAYPNAHAHNDDEMEDIILTNECINELSEL